MTVVIRVTVAVMMVGRRGVVQRRTAMVIRIIVVVAPLALIVVIRIRTLSSMTLMSSWIGVMKGVILVMVRGDIVIAVLDALYLALMIVFFIYAFQKS